MKCERCRFAPPINSEGFQDECGVFDKYGTVWKDGKEGCTLAYQTLARNERMHDEAMSQMATDWGLEHDFENHGWDIIKTIEDCKHMIGFSPNKVYHRHNKPFYKAYRNYWYGKQRDDFDYMCHKTFNYMEIYEKTHDGYVYYSLTKDGIKWLERQMKIGIREI